MEEIAVKHLGYYGAMISGSKSGYGERNPKNLAVFNSNVCVGPKKIWWGDLDLTLSKDKLLELSKELNDVVYVLYEMDGRFENEDAPLIDSYVVKFSPDGTYEINERYKEYITKNLTRKRG
jgi:hypothetical protein